MQSEAKPTPISRSPREEAERIAAELKASGNFIDVRALEDNSVAFLHDLVYTRSVVLGVDHIGNWAKRFCFSDRPLANTEFYKLKSKDDVPTGFISQRPKPYGEL